MKKSVSIVLSVIFMLTMLFSVMAIPASASNTIALSLTNTAGEVGDIVEVSVSVPENSYLVNGDFDLYYDAEYLRYIPESCEATALLEGAFWAANCPIDGEVRMSFASDASVGLTAAGALFTMRFEIINKNSTETSLSLNASPLCGCNGGDDFDVKATISGGQIGIVGGADPWNFLQAAFLESGHENVSIDENGVWTVTGDFTLSPDFTMDYNDWSYIVQKFTSNIPVKITLVDNDPLGVYGKHEIGLYDNFFGPQFYPAASYDQVNSILGIYSWNIKNAGWKNTGFATIDQVIVHFESSDNVSATFTSLYMSQKQQTTSSVVRTTATKPTTTTTTTTATTTTTTKPQELNLTFTVEVIEVTSDIVAGETFTVDVTIGEIDALCAVNMLLKYDASKLSVDGYQVNEMFGTSIVRDSLEGELAFAMDTGLEGDKSFDDETVLVTITFTARKDITFNTPVSISNVKAKRFDGVQIYSKTSNGGIRFFTSNLGDVTGDDDVNLNDATMMFYYVNGLSTLNENVYLNADVNYDGEMDLSDATALFYQVNGLV